MTFFTCEKCQKTYSIKNQARKIYCSCGAISKGPAFLNESDSLPCVYRGEVIGDLNCGCAGKPKVYACEKHGSCALRKLKPGKYDVTFCNGCEDRRYYKPNRIGLLLTCFNAIGGVETWVRILVDHVLPGSISGIATGVEAKGSANVPVYSGEDAVAELFAASDIVLTWGISELPSGVEKTKPCFAVHHGSLASTWANEVFEKQLAWCDGGIAINEEVADHYDVRYLPNPVVDVSVEKVPHDGINILWNHRWADEKRPKLMIEIAKLLPSGYKLLVSAPKGTQLPPNCVNIGLNADNNKHYSKTDLFLSTASQEAFGYSIAEAVLAKIPVVASPFGLANRLAAQLVDSDDPNHWVEAIIAAARENDDLEGRRRLLLDAYGESCYALWRRCLLT